MKGKQEIKAILLGIGMGLLVLPSCSDDVINPDRPDNGAIMLQVGVSNSPAQQPLTRAAGDTYVALSPDTKFKLRVQGTWTGKDPELITKETTATAGTAQSFTTGTAAGKENSLTFDPVLFWDDYGTGDPANAETGRKNGLDILAVAVDNATTAVPILETEWDNTKSWTLQTDGTKAKVLTGDILVANNLSDRKTPLTFANRKDPDKSRLIFQHLMSKITFNLTPADGFMLTDGMYAFTTKPTVTLNRKRYEGGTLPPGGEYALVEGTISIREAKAFPSTDNKQTVIAGDETKKEEGGAEVRTQVALVYPGTCLGAADEDVVARIEADKNYYYVTAKEIRAAINTAGGHTDYKTLPGYNYIINVTVKKTGVNVTATVTNWVDVQAEEASPVIALTAGAGSTGETGDWATTGVDGFDFFRSTAMLTGYSDETTLKEGDYYKPLRKVKWDTTSGTTSPRACVFYDNTGATETPLYWPDHDTHYHFRGVYPATTTAAESAAEPLVKTFTTAAGATEQGIAVKNGAYDKTTFPSNLMIGMPEIEAGKLCGSGEHKQEDMSVNGICARSGKINMNFRYMMSQVEIELAHSLEEGTEGDVTLDENTTVEIVGGYTEGYIRLGDREAVGQTKGSYKTNVVAGEANKLKRHDIVLPQDLTGMQFKITVNNADGTHDYYYATIQDIRVRVGEGASQSITKWEPGKHYKYTLKLKKTAMEITATLTDWITVEADEDIWM